MLAIGPQDITVGGLDLGNGRIAVQVGDARQQQARIHRGIISPVRRNEAAETLLGRGDLAARDRRMVQETGGKAEFAGPMQTVLDMHPLLSAGLLAASGPRCRQAPVATTLAIITDDVIARAVHPATGLEAENLELFSVALACRKRGIAQERLDQLVSGVQRQIETLGESEIPAKAIGEMVMEGLRGLDSVAYIRFASVYREFTEARDFEEFASSVRDAGKG